MDVHDLGTLPSCADLTSAHAKQAASSSTEFKLLLRRVTEIARPEDGCPKLLMAVAHLQGQEWVEGDLRVELAGDDVTTTLDIMCDHGFGIRERLLPAVKLNVPLDEFSRALELAPRMVFPLRIEDAPDKIVLVPLASANPGPESEAPPIELDRSALPNQRSTLPPPPDELIALDAPDEIPISIGEAAADGDPPESKDKDATPSVHTRPTVRRMVAIDPSMYKRRDPRREDDD